MRHNRHMSEPALAPRNTLGGMIAVWIAGAIAAIAIGLFVPEVLVMPWLIVALGGCLLLAFTVQLAYGSAQGYIVRVAGSVVGALLVMGTISAVFALTALVAR